MVKRTDVKEWTNSRGTGKLFSFTVTDDSGDIRITAFNEEVDKFFNIVENNKASLKYSVFIGVLFLLEATHFLCCKYKNKLT